MLGEEVKYVQSICDVVKQLAELAKVRPMTTVDLKKIEGIGEGKTERFGQEFLLAIEEYRKCAGPVAL